MNIMKKLLLFVSLLGFLVFFACTNVADSEVQKAMKAALTENLAHPEDVKFVNIKEVYSKDSLSILHVTRRGKNGYGEDVEEQFEYLYLKDHGARYEAFHELGSDSVFLDETTMNKVKKGKIYEKLDYDQALLYRSKFLMNLYGRIVGDKNREKPFYIGLKTGMWMLDRSMDEFGEHSGDRFLTVEGKGNAYGGTTGEFEIRGHLWVTASIAAIGLSRSSGLYETHGYDTSYEVRVKDSNGEIHDAITFYQTANSTMIVAPFWKEDQFKDFLNVILAGGEITFYLKETEYNDRFRFIVRSDGLTEAAKFLIEK
jgi:hypothetical protein